MLRLPAAHGAQSQPKTERMRWASAATDLAGLDAALEDVVAQTRAAFGDLPVDLAVLFVSNHYSADYDRIPAALASRWPHRTLLGCSAGAVIGGGREIEGRPGIALTVGHLPDVAIESFALCDEELPGPDAPPAAWHAALGIEPAPPPAFVMLADPFSMPIESLLAGIDYAYPRSTQIGGMASGARAPGGNVLWAGSRVTDGGAVGVALRGDIAVDTVVAQGCRPIGVPMAVTRCHRNLLLELDGKPPVQVIQELIPELPEADRRLLAQALFLGVVMDELLLEPRAGDFLIRNLIGVDPERGALAVGEHLRKGQTVQFHLRDARTSAGDLRAVLDRFAATPGATPARGALLFSCLGRGEYLYGSADHDSRMFRDRVGEVPLGGFFCNGEIGPVGGATRIHGYTSSFGIFRTRS
jgi:small ligand-binding sensory domain FIST